MEIAFEPKGVCPSRMVVEIDDDGIITRFDSSGGCDGNMKGIQKLVINRKADEVAALLEGITCGKKNTSCPDQISKLLSRR